MKPDLNLPDEVTKTDTFIPPSPKTNYLWISLSSLSCLFLTTFFLQSEDSFQIVGLAYRVSHSILLAVSLLHVFFSFSLFQSEKKPLWVSIASIFLLPISMFFFSLLSTQIHTLWAQGVYNQIPGVYLVSIALLCLVVPVVAVSAKKFSLAKKWIVIFLFEMACGFFLTIVPKIEAPPIKMHLSAPTNTKIQKSENEQEEPVLGRLKR